MPYFLLASHFMTFLRWNQNFEKVTYFFRLFVFSKLGFFFFAFHFSPFLIFLLQLFSSSRIPEKAALRRREVLATDFFLIFFFYLFFYAFPYLFAAVLFQFTKSRETSIETPGSSYHGVAKCSWGKYSSEFFTLMLKHFRTYFRLNWSNHSDLGIIGNIFFLRQNLSISDANFGQRW